MKPIQWLSGLLAGLLCMTALLACTPDSDETNPDTDQEKTQAVSTTQSTTTPKPTTTTAPSVTDDPTPSVTTTTPVTTTPSPSVTDTPTPPDTTDPTLPETEEPFIPTDYSKLTPSQVYRALRYADGVSLKIQSGPASITYDKNGNLLYTLAWDDSKDESEDFYVDFSTGAYYHTDSNGKWKVITQQGLTWKSTLDSAELTSKLFFFDERYYDLSNSNATIFHLKSDMLAANGISTAYMQRIGTTYIFFLCDNAGEDFTINVNFTTPEVTLPTT